jgi:hypothetical protein
MISPPPPDHKIPNKVKIFGRLITINFPEQDGGSFLAALKIACTRNLKV